MKNRFSFQLYISYLILIVISLIAVTLYASKSLRTFYIEKTKSDLYSRAVIFESQLKDNFNDRSKIDTLCKRIGKLSYTRFTVILPSGVVIGDSDSDVSSMENHLNRPEVKEALSGSEGISIRFSTTIQQEMIYVACPVKEGNNIIAIIRTSISLGAINKKLSEIYIRIIMAGVIIIIFATILSGIVSTKLTYPLKEIKNWSTHLALGEFQYEFPVKLCKSEEINSLFDSMRKMALKLDEQFKTIICRKNEFEAVLASMVEGVLAIDTNERIININNSALKLFNINHEEIRGKFIQEVIRNSKLYEFIRQTLTSEELQETEIILTAESETYLKIRGSVLYDSQHNNIGALIVINDITRIKKLENIRREFVANVSHELKTPITTIKGFTETLLEGAVDNPKELKHFLTIIDRDTERMVAIIDDLLVLSRLEEEAEKSDVKLEKHNIKFVINDAIESCREKADEKDISIVFNPAKEEISANLNPLLFKQAIFNLIDNAIKYSDNKSQVTIDITQSDLELIVRVSDTGWGIEEKHLSRIFERFYRVEKSRDRKLGGTGLGLAIVKHIVLVHNGRITVESIPGKGSSFQIYLPKTV